MSNTTFPFPSVQSYELAACPCCAHAFDVDTEQCDGSAICPECGEAFNTEGTDPASVNRLPFVRIVNGELKVNGYSPTVELYDMRCPNPSCEFDMRTEVETTDPRCQCPMCNEIFTLAETEHELVEAEEPNAPADEEKPQTLPVEQLEKMWADAKAAFLAEIDRIDKLTAFTGPDKDMEPDFWLRMMNLAAEVKKAR